MTEHLNGNGRAGRSKALVVVRVEDAIDPRLTARVGFTYESPPQPREQAMTLVRLLLGRTEPTNGSDRWVAPIAGGRRVVTLNEEPGR
jgi:hypothetical protein